MKLHIYKGFKRDLMITIGLVVLLVILKMMGKNDLAKPTIDAILEEPIENTSGRRLYNRAIIEKRYGQFFARLTGPQGSGILTSMAEANGLMVVPEDTAVLREGDTVEVQMLDWAERQGA